MAGRPRQPLKLAEIKGATARSPGRYTGRTEPKAPPLGEPSEKLTEAEKEAWNEFAADLPWLGRPDRALLEIACRRKVRLRTDPGFGVNAMAQLRMCLAATVQAEAVGRSRSRKPIATKHPK